MDKLGKEVINNFFPVQRQVIPYLLELSSRYRPGPVTSVSQLLLLGQGRQ